MYTYGTFDNSTYIVYKDSKEFCVVSEYEGQALPAEVRALFIVSTLNGLQERVNEISL